jgi:hypothetical protein
MEIEDRGGENAFGCERAPFAGFQLLSSFSERERLECANSVRSRRSQIVAVLRQGGNPDAELAVEERGVFISPETSWRFQTSLS